MIFFFFGVPFQLQVLLKFCYGSPSVLLDFVKQELS